MVQIHIKMPPNCQALTKIILHCSQAQIYCKSFTYFSDVQCSCQCSFSFTGEQILSTGPRSQSTANKNPSISLQYLERDLEFLYLKSIYESSRKTYHQGQSIFLSLCRQHNMTPYPLQELAFRLFASHFAGTVSYETIQTYLVAALHRHIDLRFLPYFAQIHLLHLLLLGTKRAKCSFCRPIRTPITLDRMKEPKEIFVQQHLHPKTN